MRILCPAMMMILLLVGTLLVSFSFHFPFPTLSLSAMMNPWKVSTVLFHYFSKGYDSSLYTAKPDLVDRSKGWPSENGFNTMVRGGVGAY